MIYIVEILNTTHFLRDIRENIEIGAEAKKGNIYIFSEITEVFEGYWTCVQVPKVNRYIAKKDTRVRVFSLENLLQFTVGLNPTFEDVEKQMAAVLTFFLRVFHNKREDTD